MTVTKSRCIADYPILAACASDLHACSKDDSEKSSPEFLFDEEGVFAINFDGVMQRLCEEAKNDDESEAIGVARSVDALYVGTNSDSWNETISLIEFKNGNLRERRRRALSKRERAVFAHGLAEAIDGLLLRKVSDIGWPAYEELSEPIEREIESFVGMHLDKGGDGTARMGEPHHKGDYFAIETIKTKAACSALALQRVLDVPISFIKENVDFVLVYNPDRNPETADDIDPGDDRAVPSIPSIDSKLPLMLASCAKRPLRRFGLRETLGAFFHDVIACTPEELRRYLTSQ